MNIGCEFGDLGDRFVDHFKLALAFFVLKVDHANLFLLLSDGLLSLLETVLLDVALFIVNAKLVVAVNELNTHVIA